MTLLSLIPKEAYYCITLQGRLCYLVCYFMDINGKTRKTKWLVSCKLPPVNILLQENANQSREREDIGRKDLTLSFNKWFNKWMRLNMECEVWSEAEETHQKRRCHWPVIILRVVGHIFSRLEHSQVVIEKQGFYVPACCLQVWIQALCGNWGRFARLDKFSQVMSFKPALTHAQYAAVKLEWPDMAVQAYD